MNPEDLPKPTLRPPDLPKVEIPPPQPPGDSSPPPRATVENPIPLKIRVAEREDADAPTELRAPFNPRFIAAVIDALIAAGIHFTVSWLLPGSLEGLAWPIGIAYWLFRDSLAVTAGRSIGKSAMKLQAVTLDGSPLVGHWKPALIRNLPCIIPPFFLVEVIVLLNREEQPSKRGRLGDEWAKTKVVVVPEPESEEDPKA